MSIGVCVLNSLQFKYKPHDGAIRQQQPETMTGCLLSDRGRQKWKSLDGVFSWRSGGAH